MKHILIILLSMLCAYYLKAEVYEVGNDKEYQRIGDVPWESPLNAGDTVKIYQRDQPYREKWLITGAGTDHSPIVIIGIPNDAGLKPVIDGENAITCPRQNYWNEPRGVIKIGGSNIPADQMPENIILQGLDIRSGRVPYAFTGRNGITEYEWNSAGIFIEKGNNITIMDCDLHDNGNGLFIAEQTNNALIHGCRIYDNGNPGRYLEHNSYTSAMGIIFQFNYYGPLKEGCDGNNLKDRSAGLIVRYNHIEDGNRQLDLVDAGSEELINDPSYRETYVYGNVLVEHDGEGNSQMIHYGGDSGDENRLRKGTLYLYNNTIVSYRSGNTTLVRLSSEHEQCQAFNNIIMADHLGFISDNGFLCLENNFFKNNAVVSHSATNGEVDEENNIKADDPGFMDYSCGDFHLTENSVCIGAGIDFPQNIIEKGLTPLMEPDMEDRQYKSPPDLGAFAYPDDSGIDDPVEEEIIAWPNPFREVLNIRTRFGQQIRIQNILGQLIMEYKAGTDGKVEFQPQAPGIYFITISSTNGKTVYKAVKI